MLQLLTLAQQVATAAADCGDGSKSCDTGLPKINATGVQLNQILAIFFGILAAISVLMIIIAGLHFISSQGNPQETARARDTILYAIIGLVVALLAESIVFFVLRRV